MSTSSLDLDTASEIPPSIRFGCSTWTYPGWKGLIYFREYRSDKAFRRECLREYAECPLFRTVGIDRSFYGPLPLETLTDYARMVPEGFLWVSKAWERFTIPVYPRHARYGKHAGKVNPDFLNASAFVEEWLAPYERDEIRARSGPFVFQFPTISKRVLDEIDFFEHLKTFLSALPPHFEYAVEIRNPELLNEQYFGVLNETGATHCFNHWNYMPSLRKQMELAASAGGLDAPFFVARILTPRGVSYEQAVKRFQPYDSIKQPDPEMRADVVRLVKRALKRGSRAFVVVNNRCEGNSPLTINEIIKLCQNV